MFYYILLIFILTIFSVPGETVFYGEFDELFGSAEWEEAWGIAWNNRVAECEIIYDERNQRNALRITYPYGGIGPVETGVQFPIVFADISGLDQAHYDELRLRYYFKFEEGFDFRLGGKLPGLMGGGDSWARSGGNQPDGTNGWTLRFMWRENGRIVVYAYLPPSENGMWGSEVWGQDIDCNFVAEPGTWHYIDQYVHVGTPGKDDGKLIVWIDGVERLNINNIRFWNVENYYGRIGGIFFSTFHGGNTPEWAPLHDSYMQCADISVFRK